MTMLTPDQIAIEFLVLADFARVVEGKLYLQGGGWDRKLKPPGEERIQIQFAAGFLVPWHETNEEHHFSVGIVDADGNSLGEAVEGGLNMGRPQKSVRGQAFRAVLAGTLGVPPLDIGTYAVEVTITPDAARRYAVFHVVSQL